VLEQRLQALRTQVSQLEAKVDRQAELAGWAASAADFCARVREGLASADFAQKRQLIELLVDRVLISNGEVEIRYVLPLSAGSEKVRFCHLRKDYFHLQQIPIPQHRLQRGDLGVGAQDEDAVEPGLVRQLAGIDLERRPGLATVAGRTRRR
jgi:hypothetical protein